MKSYCDKSTAKRGWLRMGGKPECFETSVMERGGKWIVDDSAFPKKAKRISIRRRAPHFPVCNRPHLTGAGLIAHIQQFDKSRNLRPGSRYIIGGQEVIV